MYVADILGSSDPRWFGVSRGYQFIPIADILRVAPTLHVAFSSFGAETSLSTVHGRYAGSLQPVYFRRFFAVTSLCTSAISAVCCSNLFRSVLGFSRAVTSLCMHVTDIEGNPDPLMLSCFPRQQAYPHRRNAVCSSRGVVPCYMR